jgi:L-lactate utilization protein LutC
MGLVKHANLARIRIAVPARKYGEEEEEEHNQSDASILHTAVAVALAGTVGLRHATVSPRHLHRSGADNRHIGS